MSKADRKAVEKFWAAHGFYVAGTGGGCEALERKRIGGGYIWVTDQDDPSLPDTLTAPVCVGWYNEQGNIDLTADADNSVDAVNLIVRHGGVA